MRILVVVCLLGSLLGAAETRSAPSPQAKTAPARTATPAKAPASKSDADIERTFREKLAKSKLANDKIQIRVQGGVATIEGKTDVVQRKGAATRMAKSAGARQVVNKIEVSDAAKEKSAENLTQGRRRAQVKRGDTRTEER
jgi:hypothetical protein